MFNKGLTYTYTKAETSGIFALEHTFEFSGGSEGNTCEIAGKSNLMDYCSPQGTFMAVWQWNLLDNHKDRIIPFLEGDEDGELKGKNSIDKIINIIEMLRCGYVSNRKVRFTKDTWLGSESVMVENFNGLYDGVTYKFIFAELKTDNVLISIPNKITYSIDDGFLSTMVNGETAVFDFGELIVKVDKAHADALQKYLQPTKDDMAKQSNQFVEKICDAYKRGDYTRYHTLSILLVASQCMFENLSEKNRIYLLNLINCGSNIPESDENIVLDLIRTTPKEQIDQLLKDMITYKLMPYYDSAINDFGGEDNYTKFIKYMAELFYETNEKALSDAFQLTPLGQILIPVQQQQFGPYTLTTPLVKYIDWKCDEMNVEYEDNELNLNKLCGGGGKASPFDIVVVYFENDEADEFIGIEGKRAMEDRVIAMPAFILNWLSWQISKSSAANTTDNIVTIASFVMPLAKGPSLAGKIGKVLFALKMGKEAINVALINDDFKNLIKSLCGDDVEKEWDRFGYFIDYIVEPSIGKLTKLDIKKTKEMYELFDHILASWDIIKQAPEIDKYLDDNQVKELQEIMNQLQDLHDETTKNIVE